ncbi:helix-turn-helix domain-containing protein [Soonwooa sp.]|uniref:helix-turn-helix domain-containing protein n=1 Tax=Soonwooa sp. TaxID=1938592 RepID=UPI0035B19363
MDSIQFIGIAPKDLITELKNSLIPELKAQLSAEFQPKQPKQYLTRAEVCRLLSINQSTLYRWCKDGTISSFGVGNRIYFLRSDIDDLILKNKLS